MKKNNIIFLISQPRAGSTMLQRILGSHPQIHTSSEPWIMLHPLYALKQSGIDTEYSSDLALDGLRDFLSSIENGSAVYTEKLREMYSSLYDMVTAPSGKKFYLDKTPRYYFIIEELHELFPDAKIIILLRNPLAVLASMVETWTKQDWYRLSEYKHDLLRGPDLLLSGLDRLGTDALRIIYEDVLAEPDLQIKRVCEFLGIDFDTNMIRYGNSDLPKWKYGDPQTVYEKSSPDSFHAEKWIESLANPQVWRVLREYLDFLGKDRLDRMGYSFSELDTVLEKNRPGIDIEKYSVGFHCLLDNVRDAQLERKELRAQVRMKENQIAQHESQMQVRLQEIQGKNAVIQQKDQQIQHYISQIKKQDDILTQVLSKFEGYHETKLNLLKKMYDNDNSNSQKMDIIQKEYLGLFDKAMNGFHRQLENRLVQKDEQLQARDHEVKNLLIQLHQLKTSYPYRFGRTVLFPLILIKRALLRINQVMKK